MSAYRFLPLLPIALLIASCADTIADNPELAEWDHEHMDEDWFDNAQVVSSEVANVESVRDLVRSGACSTGLTSGLNAQIAGEINCIEPGLFEYIDDIPNVQLGPGANPFLQREAAQALRKAAADDPNHVIYINSTWRSVAQQQILKDWEGSCGIRIAARPGRSRHESGLAMDLRSESTAVFLGELRGADWSWYCDRNNRGRASGCGDPPHWDYFRGEDLRSTGVLAFQRLWNRANPDDKISEDGLYGPQTAARIRKAPVRGFPSGTTCGGPEPTGDEPPPAVDDDDRGPAAPDGEVGQPVIDALSTDAERDSAANVSIWRTRAPLSACGTATVPENYATGRYQVHRYEVDAGAAGNVNLKFERTAGGWSPAIFVFDRRGDPVYLGDAPAGHPNVEVSVVTTGRFEGRAEVNLTMASPTQLYAYISSWEVFEAGFAQYVPRDARYRFVVDHTCAIGGGGSGAYGGIDLDGMSVPRAGLNNATLRSVHGHLTERHGDTVSYDGNSYVRGKVSWFGGPNDSGVSSNETGAITGERLRRLHDPPSPSNSTLASRPEDYYYIAMRWNYSPNGRAWWGSARLLVVNPHNGRSVVVRPIDWGPHDRTGRVMDLSPQVLDDLGIVTDDDALVSFARPGTPLGPQ